MQHVLDLLDWDKLDLLKLLKEAAKLKKAHLRGKNDPLLAGRVLGLIFEKPSLRTRVSFQAAVAQLGGGSVFLNGAEAALGKRESIGDFARTISQYVDGVVLRTFQHQTVEDFARFATIPVINGLSDYYHPCQVLGDLLTMQENMGALEGKHVAFIGDGNNVARSLAIVCGKLKMPFVLASPRGFGFDRPFQDLYRRLVNGVLNETTDAPKAVRDADVIYTDVWTSMGQEDQAITRRKHFDGFQVNVQLLKQSPKEALVMHCLPAHRGDEITDEVLDGDRCVAFPQAGNRMHAQKALLVRLMKPK